MFQIERLDELYRYISKNQSASVEELSRLFGVSKVTIRSDINELANKGLVIKTYGGAVSASHSFSTEIPYDSKYSINSTQKRRVAKAAAEMIEDNDVVILDAGTTTFEVVSHITCRNVTIVTNDIRIAAEVAHHGGLKLIVAGGELEESVYTLVGMNTERFLSEIRANKAIMGCDAYDLNFGISNRTLLEVYAKQAMMRAADKKIIITDSSKLGKCVFARMCGPFDMDVFITDAMEQSMRAQMEEAGVEVLIPE